jgi:hypothetical protein
MIVANLDCEVEWAGAPPLPAAVRARIGALGTLLRVLGDAPLELVAPVDPARVTEVTKFGAHHRHGTIAPRRCSPPHFWGATARYPASGDVSVARTASDRRLAARLAGDGIARVVDSVAALEALLPALVEESPARAWVAKATICAAGRDRVRRRGAAVDDATRTRLGRLLARGGALVVEPWLDRVADYGQAARIDDAGAVLLDEPHRLLCTDDGGFRGIDGDAAVPPPIRAALADAAGRAGAALAALGHRGRFAIDAFAHAGGVRALVEINPRLSFGVIARAWAERLGVAGTLEVGTGEPPAGAIPLLLPGTADPTSAWFTASRR